MDGIDVSEWLRPNEMEAMAARLKERGDLSVHYHPNGRLQAILPATETVLEYMDRREWLSTQEVEAGRRLIMCRMAFQVQQGAKTARYEAMMFAGAGELPSMTDDYRRLLRRVGKRDFDVAVYVCDTGCTVDMREAVYANRGRITEALAAVGKALAGKETACA